MSEESSYYPPRARGWGRTRGVRYSLMRLIGYQDVSLSHRWGSRFSRHLVGYTVPGFGFYLTGFWKVGLACMGIFCVALILYVTEVGRPLANYALGGMVGIHFSGSAFYFRKTAEETDASERRRYFVYTLILIFCFYIALQGVFGRWVTPVQFQDRIYVANRLFPVKNVRAGDWILYSVEQYSSGVANHTRYVVQAGLNLGKVLAVSGDVIKFGTNEFSVNNNTFTNLQNMPVEGGMTVPTNKCFVWADYYINGLRMGANVDAQVNQAIMQRSLVNKFDYSGKIFNRWFWHKQL